MRKSKTGGKAAKGSTTKKAGGLAAMIKGLNSTTHTAIKPAAKSKQPGTPVEAEPATGQVAATPVGDTAPAEAAPKPTALRQALANGKKLVEKANGEAKPAKADRAAQKAADKAKREDDREAKRAEREAARAAWLAPQAKAHAARATLDGSPIPQE